MTARAEQPSGILAMVSGVSYARAIDFHASAGAHRVRRRRRLRMVNLPLTPRVRAMRLTVESARLRPRDDGYTRTAALGHADGGDGRLVRRQHRLPRLGRRASHAPPPSAQDGGSPPTLRVRATLHDDTPAWLTPRDDGHTCNAAHGHADDADERPVRPRHPIPRLGRRAPHALPRRLKRHLAAAHSARPRRSHTIDPLCYC